MKINMKKTALEVLRLLASGALSFGSICLFYLSLDVLDSLCAGLPLSLINGQPASLAMYLMLWACIICLVISYLGLHGLSINRQAGRKKILGFWVLVALMLLTVQAGHDIAFSYKLGVHSSVMFKLPINKWLLGGLVMLWVGLLIVFSELIHQVFHGKMDRALEKLEAFLKEEDKSN
jgi:hypothetical protein